MGLPQDYRFHFVNNLGVDMDLSSNSANEDVDLYLLAYKYDSNGALEYDGSEVAQSYSAADIADGNSAEFAAIDNSIDLFTGLTGRLVYKTDDATADGTVDLYIEFTTDGGTTFPSDSADWVAAEDGLLITKLRIVGDGAGYERSTSFRI